MCVDLDKQNDGLENFSEPDGTVVPMFCPTCGHPPGYHHPERGCTMPLDSAGLPVARTVQTVGACHCGESMRHKRERLRAAMYAAKTVFKDAERAYTEELHAQREALSAKDRSLIAEVCREVWADMVRTNNAQAFQDALKMCWECGEFGRHARWCSNHNPLLGGE